MNGLAFDVRNEKQRRGKVDLVVRKKKKRKKEKEKGEPKKRGKNRKWKGDIRNIKEKRKTMFFFLSWC